jgi:serine/threonine-protein kinase
VAKPLAEVRSRLFGRYEIVREVANTATARVVECIDTVRSEHVAVKIFAGYNVRGGGRDVLARFEREVKVLGTLDHPNVVPLRDYYPDGPALVLAWMSGGTLETMIASRAIAPSRAVEIACAVLSALGEAHRLGVLHRDLKPANVLFDGAGAARLSDFGVAHLGDLSATATAGLIGTLGYMSPEQREGKPATVQSDVYGVGAVLFEMLTGERMGFEAVAKILPSGVHRDLGPRHDDVVLSLLAQDPSARPPDAFAARRALTALSWPTTLEPAAALPKSQRSPSHHPEAARVHATEDGHEVDAWIGRPIERIALTDAVLARAAAFARAGDPSLQTVLRVDREAREIWLDAPRGAILDRPLKPTEEELLRRALDTLHGAGSVHGSVDRAHVVVGPGDAVVLRFAADAEPTATVDRDRLQLSRL